MNFHEKATILDGGEMVRAVRRIAHEVVEANKGCENVVIVGVQRRGVTIARRVVDCIKEAEGVDVPLGTLDITFYRDDLSTLGPVPKVGKTDLSFDVNDKHIILVDDVLYTGRTVRAALDELMDFGRPSSIQLAVLIDRGHRELPIRPDFVGKNVPTSAKEVVKVMVDEFDGREAVVVGEVSGEAKG
jgi:pyrimidine operon attenuation protein/uracil phosphoribosyltransferase